MPGIFGTVGLPRQLTNELAKRFERAWSDSAVATIDSCTIGGHAFDEFAAVYQAADHSIYAVDGDLSAYVAFQKWVTGRNERALGEHSFVCSEVLEHSCGSLAHYTPSTRVLTLSTDPSGMFPLYYAAVDDGIAFSTLQAPLAAISGSKLNAHALRQFTRAAFVVGRDTLFSGVSRLLPGQILSFSVGTHPSFSSDSDAWITDSHAIANEVEAELWSLLKQPVEAEFVEGPTMLMMSGGWDSRTLLATRDSDSRFTCYSHGNLQSRELRLVRKICRDLGVECTLEPLDDRMLSPDLLSLGLRRTESISFPHWHLAGASASQNGLKIVSAGILGEVLGGHYGPAMHGSARSRAQSLLQLLLTKDSRRGLPAFSAMDKLSIRQAPMVPWYLNNEMFQSPGEFEEEYNSAVRDELSRQRHRGVSDEIALLEAFISEHRGAQYIGAQLRSCRAHTNVSVPFARRSAYVLASRVPLERRVHNRINRTMLRRFAPELTEFPMAATLVRARYPILVQEASRALRKAGERFQERTRSVIGAPTAPAPLGWVDFEFIRSSESFSSLMQSLSSDVWDRSEIFARLDRLRSLPDAASAHPMFDQCMKILTADRLIAEANATT